MQKLYEIHPKFATVNTQPTIDKRQKLRLLNAQRQALSKNSPYNYQFDRRKIKSVARDENRKKSASRRQFSNNKFRIQQINYVSNRRQEQNLINILKKESKHSKFSFNSKGNKPVQRELGFTENIPIHQKLDLQQDPRNKTVEYETVYKQILQRNEEKKHENQFRRRKYIQSSLQNNIHLHKFQNNLKRLSQTINPIDTKKYEQVQTHPKKFRKNKFEAIQSQATICNNTNLMNIEQINMKQHAQYNSVDIQKKQSNSSLIRQLDLETQKQIFEQEKVIKQKMKKILQKSLEKSTEQYFTDTSYPKRLKSKNQIEIYLSTVKNPKIQRISEASTLVISDAKEKNQFISKIKPSSELVLYDFDLQAEDVSKERHGQIRDETSQEYVQQKQSNNLLQSSDLDLPDQMSIFDKQRKQIQKKFINRPKQLSPVCSQQELIAKYNDEEFLK